VAFLLTEKKFHDSWLLEAEDFLNRSGIWSNSRNANITCSAMVFIS
jgi:hypothetical protein